MYLETLLTEITQTLSGMQIPYMLTGSLAYNIYSIPRATRDIDLIIEMKEKDIEVFLHYIKNKYYYSEQTIREEVKRKGMFNIIHLESSYKIDLIVHTNDIFEVAKFHRRKRFKIFKNEIYVITAEDLIISKLRWIQILESELHKRDITILLKNPAIDLEYIKQWCHKLNLKTFDLI